MKNLLTAIIFVMALAGFTSAQGSKSAQRSGASAKTRIAVVEFTPGPNAGVMDHETKRQLQAFVASQLAKTHKFDVYDVRNTRAASQNDLAALNGSGSTAAAVRLGKKLDVSYVLTGTVPEYDPQGGQVTLKARFIEVATGKVKYSGESTGQSTTAIRSGGSAEMMSKAVRPAILDLTGRIAGI